MTKARSFKTGTRAVFSPSYYNGEQIAIVAPVYDGYYYGYEELISQGHKWPPPRGSNGDFGGPFSVRRAQWKVQPGYGYISKPHTGFVTRGATVQEPSEASHSQLGVLSLPAFISESTMLAMGTKGWAKYKPTRSQGGLDQALGEAHQIPSIMKIRNLKEAFKSAKAQHGWHLPIAWRTNRFLKDASDNYLNYVFGWVPLINDLADLVDNSWKLEKRLRQLIKDNGKPVMRRGPIDSTTTSSNSADSTTSGSGWLFPGCGDSPVQTKHVSSQTTTKFTFSGRFRYYLNFHESTKKLAFGQIGSRENYQLTRLLYGGEITPQTLYNIMPWSWLIDWVAPLGDLIGNVVNDPIDNLTADFAYVTARSTSETSYRVRSSGTYCQPFETTATLSTELIQRRGASPYGFGLLWTDFSPKQLSILAALGYQKLG